MGTILFAQVENVQVLKLSGDVRVTLGPTISRYLESIGQETKLKSIIIDLTEAIGIDSTSLGLLAKISLRSQEFLKVLPTIVSTNVDVTRILHSMGFERVFLIVEDTDLCCEQMGELPTSVVSEPELREQVLEAHRVLMGLNKSNEMQFKDLVEALEKEKSALSGQADAKPPRYAHGC
ncbi:MAG: STAS domain-containing protein [Gammaproteobacteria bacterium]|jgi:anti-anti-sigma factor|nr:STAS domain-containing protein [Gammaproteobacteria bacterium]